MRESGCGYQGQLSGVSCRSRKCAVIRKGHANSTRGEVQRLAMCTDTHRTCRFVSEAVHSRHAGQRLRNNLVNHSQRSLVVGTPDGDDGVYRRSVELEDRGEVEHWILTGYSEL
ncbi:hypothetical protein BLNAU_5070 [Blattamonas nauphoetae]|uniref:Uncharacterized protein n=1 Tax=Blattamonas nauphoetae TaxID=2049346 RepID=A0ABQ9Y854_9EUKA|nr:hypothetical protein BLNAU_5070 [Blattamonas nauphoetae]